MNWKEIWQQMENKYPKAYALWMQFDSPEVKICVTYRDLYNFFDEQGIFGWASPEIQYTREIDENYRNPHYCIDEWGYDIHDNSDTLDIGYPFNSRLEAEEAMFEKEFELLEERL